MFPPGKGMGELNRIHRLQATQGTSAQLPRVENRDQRSGRHPHEQEPEEQPSHEDSLELHGQEDPIPLSEINQNRDESGLFRIDLRA